MGGLPQAVRDAAADYYELTDPNGLGFIGCSIREGGRDDDPRVQRFAADLVLSAAAAISAATTDMIEAGRGQMDLASNLRSREVAENLADALQSVCSIELEAEDCPADRREAVGDLLAAASRFIEGWA